MKKIGIYGGSFDPVHIGHRAAMDEFLRLADLDELLLIPSGIPPHKEFSTVTPSGTDRLEMLKLAVDGLRRVRISELELVREGKSYTFDTLSMIREAEPDSRLFLLMGTDMFLSFESWYRYREVCSMATLCVMARSDCLPTSAEAVLEQAQKLETNCGAEILLLDNRPLEMSSTTARRMIFFDAAEECLDPSVYAYIRRMGLYGRSRSYRALSLEELIEVVRPLYEPKRYLHAVGCMQTAARLAKLYGEDPESAARAGILHDITKALGIPQQLQLCRKFGIDTTEFSCGQEKILHGKTAAAAAERIFGESEPVCSAICWHTTGRANMTVLEKIIYISDYMEPNRDFDGVELLRTLAETDLDKAVLCGIDMTLELLKENKKTLNRYSVEAKEYLMGKG